jgi:hypothetical protein
MRDEQSIERIARPAQIDRSQKPGGSRRIIQHPAVIIHDGLHAPVPQPDAVRLDKEL